MKRKDLMKRLVRFAKTEALEIEIVEGGSHTRVAIGDRKTVVPQHSEINEITARAILRQMGADR